MSEPTEDTCFYLREGELFSLSMEMLYDLGTEILVGIIATIAMVVLGKLWSRLTHRRSYLSEALEHLARWTVQLPVIGVGAFLLFLTIIFQAVPFVWAAQGNVSNYSPIVLFLTFLTWEGIVYAMFRVSVKLVRFRVRFRFRTRGGIAALGHGFPITLWKPLL